MRQLGAERAARQLEWEPSGVKPPIRKFFKKSLKRGGDMFLDGAKKDPDPPNDQPEELREPPSPDPKEDSQPGTVGNLNNTPLNFQRHLVRHYYESKDRCNRDKRTNEREMKKRGEQWEVGLRRENQK